MDEDLRLGLDPRRDRARLRDFGRGLAIVLALAALLAWRRHSPKAPWDLGAAALSATLSRLRPAFFSPLYRLWMPVARALARVNTFLLLGLFYYAVLTPCALLRRLLGGATAPRPGESYWIPREKAEPRRDCARQF